MPYVANVGWNSYEAVDAAVAGANFGWPCYEGPAGTRQSGYSALAACQALYALSPNSVRPPALTYAHTPEASASITGGVFYTGAAFPSVYRDAYFYGDYALGSIRYATFSPDETLASDNAFANDADGPVAIELGPDGALYYLAIYTGQLRRVAYVPQGSLTGCPIGKFLAEYFTGSGMAGTPEFRRCESEIDTNWGGAAPGNLDARNFSVRWSGQFTFTAGSYAISLANADGARVYIDDALIVDVWARNGPGKSQANFSSSGGLHRVRVEYHNLITAPQATLGWTLVQPAHRPPVATVLLPSTQQLYKVGDVIQFQGSALDPEDGSLAATSIEWRVVLHHCVGTGCHQHTLLTSTGPGGSFTVPDHGDAGFLEVVMTGTDATGLTGISSVTLRPRMVNLTLASVPDGLDVGYGGLLVTTPFTVATVAGSVHTLYVPSPQDATVFASWSDGGSQLHDITVGTTDAKYTATMLGPLALSAAVSDVQSPRSAATILVTTIGVVSTDAAIAVRVYGPGGEVVFEQKGQVQSFAPGQRRETPVVWPPDATLSAGSYEIALAAYDGTSGALVAANDSAARVLLTGIPSPIDGGQRLFFPVNR